MRRRDFIRVAGGGAVASALAASPVLGVGGAQASASGDAVWEAAAARETDPRRRALAFAQLAPNPHNMQPWLVDLAGPDEIRLFIDPTRLLPVTDPFDRQITIGTGAFIALLAMAAEADGRRAVVHAFPEGAGVDRLDGRPVAVIRLQPGEKTPRDPLFSQVLLRRTSRVAFKAEPVDGSVVEAVTRLGRRDGVAVGAEAAGRRLETLRRLVEDAALVEQEDKAANDESADRTFIGSRAVAEHPWGVALRGLKYDLLAAAGLLTRDGLKTPGSLAFKGQIDFMRSLARTSQAFVWITTPQNSRADQLAAGGAYLRVNLATTAQGLAVHPMSQALQEYPAMAPLLRRAHEALAPDGGRVQMLARLGHAEQTPHAPRRGVDALIRRS